MFTQKKLFLKNEFKGAETVCMNIAWGFSLYLRYFRFLRLFLFIFVVFPT
jgi:hypothetical protein